MSPSPKEPSVFPVAPAKVFPTGHNPGVPDGMSDTPTPDASARDVIALRISRYAGRLHKPHQSEISWRDADDILQALADAGYTVARLEQIGWQDAEDDVWTYADYDGDPPRPSDRPVYRIVGSSDE